MGRSQWWRCSIVGGDSRKVAVTGYFVGVFVDEAISPRHTRDCFANDARSDTEICRISTELYTTVGILIVKLKKS